MSYSVYLKKSEEKRLLSGHSWVYANEVERIDGKDKNGSLASVFSHDGRYIGKGYINHLSKILVRIFIRGSEEDTEEFYTKRITECNEARKRLGYDNCYRVVFAESDDLPALIVDKYGDYLSIQLLSLGMDLRRELIVRCLVNIFSPKGIYERSDVAVRKKEGLEPVKGLLYGEVPDYCPITENGLKMLVDVKNGQKTGYFLDQKENRAAVRRYSSGEVLDCFCNSGGFSMNAATRADRVTACDISPLALENVKANAKANGFSNIQTLQGDVFELLRSFRKSGKYFDMVILDPPAFCKSANEVKDACRGYKDINISAMKIVRPGGYLVTCSCSHYMSRQLFEKMLSEASYECGRPVRILETRTQAPDHPAKLSMDETCYLKCYVLKVD